MLGLAEYESDEDTAVAPALKSEQQEAVSAPAQAIDARPVDLDTPTVIALPDATALFSSSVDSRWLN